MSGIELRPRFKLKTPLKREQLLEQFKHHLKNNPKGFNGTVRDYHVVINLPKADQHYWSPQLDLSIDESESRTVVKGVMGPKPNVWTKFIFIYSALGLIATFGLMVGISQITLDQTNWGMWVFGVASLGLVAAYFIAQAGKKLGHDQMHELYNFLLDELNHCVEPIPEF
jgi:hypothetical protein